jgi:hypothetical protein
VSDSFEELKLLKAKIGELEDLLSQEHIYYKTLQNMNDKMYSEILKLRRKLVALGVNSKEFSND